jgi:hypothetical protein
MAVRTTGGLQSRVTVRWPASRNRAGEKRPPRSPRHGHPDPARLPEAAARDDQKCLRAWSKPMNRKGIEAAFGRSSPGKQRSRGPVDYLKSRSGATITVLRNPAPRLRTSPWPNPTTTAWCPAGRAGTCAAGLTPHARLCRAPSTSIPARQGLSAVTSSRCRITFLSRLSRPPPGAPAIRSQLRRASCILTWADAVSVVCREGGWTRGDSFRLLLPWRAWEWTRLTLARFGVGASVA